MLPTFPFKKVRYTMPQLYLQRSVTSAAGDYDDTYSLGGSTALGQNPNLGYKLLGQVLTMSNYTAT